MTYRGLRLAGIAVQAAAALAVLGLVATELAAHDIWAIAGTAGGLAIIGIVAALAAWCVAGPFLFASATRTQRTLTEMALAFALVGPGPLLLIGAVSGLARVSALL